MIGATAEAESSRAAMERRHAARSGSLASRAESAGPLAPAIKLSCREYRSGTSEESWCVRSDCNPAALPPPPGLLNGVDGPPSSSEYARLCRPPPLCRGTWGLGGNAPGGCRRWISTNGAERRSYSEDAVSGGGFEMNDIWREGKPPVLGVIRPCWAEGNRCGGAEEEEAAVVAKPEDVLARIGGAEVPSAAPPPMPLLRRLSMPLAAALAPPAAPPRGRSGGGAHDVSNSTTAAWTAADARQTAACSC